MPIRVGRALGKVHLAVAGIAAVIVTGQRFGSIPVIRAD